MHCHKVADIRIVLGWLRCSLSMVSPVVLTGPDSGVSTAGAESSGKLGLTEEGRCE